MGILPSPEFLALQTALAGRYSLERELGRGGMGIVFLARDVALDRYVAIKLLPPERATAPEVRERFLREARIAAKLSHPNIVPIYLVEAQETLVHFVMAYVDGESLGQRIRRAGPLPPSIVTKIVQEVAWALGHAHGRGVIHRDIKPDNILLEKGSGRALVTDFGIARVAEAGPLTSQGELLGTVHYMSPEQAAGEALDGRSDLYSLGVTAYLALTGKLPFDGPNMLAIIHRITTVPAPPVAAQGRPVPPTMAEALDRCLSKDPAARFATAEALGEAIATMEPLAAEVPPMVRALLRLVREASVGITMLGGFLYVLAAFFESLLTGVRALPLDDRLTLGFVIASWPLLYAARIVSAARRLIRDGVGWREVRAALVGEARALDEEAVASGEAEPARKRRRNQERTIELGPYLGAAGAAVTALGLSTAGSDLNIMVIGVVTLLYGAWCIGAGPPCPPDSHIAGLPPGQRLLAGRFGRLLFHVAGVGLMPPPEPLPRDRTEVVLASAADQLFERLPEKLRRYYHRVPDFIRKLEAHARALRVREAELNQAIAHTAPPHSAAGAELDAARARVRQRLEGAVGALENLRLDLLRLEAGIGSEDDLTADLERAREIGEEIDAELEARREVLELLDAGGKAARPAVRADT